MELSAKEHTGGAVQLRHYHALGSVDDEGTLRGHIRNHAQIDMLLKGLEVLVLRVFTAQFHLGLQWHTISQATFDTLLNGLTRRIDIIIQEFKFEIVSRIRDGKILFEDFVQAFVQTVVGIGFNLEEVFERLDLNVEKIRVIKFAYRREIYYCGFFFCQGTKKLIFSITYRE